ncbi:hypothetical protein BDN70DRAFT_68212 [Pholiota conissans]|uniref:Protein kinase domain-containing protein n=1 Tax=Pholiota conissans TaxID=109636 RepID=A0A9P5Z1K8_9AGAR|nr:hypothetical protein BDN70DRAFT_68212 [Pholiota conissans]
MMNVRQSSIAGKAIPIVLFIWLLLFRSKFHRSVRALCNQFFWTLRAKLPGIPAPLPRTLDSWTLSAAADIDFEQLKREVITFQNSWRFLKPFFATRGYVLYEHYRPPHSPMLIAAPSDNQIRESNIPAYPYARRAYNEDIEAMFTFSSLQVWAARDHLGRDVVIKVVADNLTRSELEILQLLNSEKMRKDPRNHTIPVIEFVQFQQYTFVIMPRWYGGLWLDFGTVDELMWFAQSMLEAFDFLHEYHIVHFDFLDQNLGVNVLADANALQPKGLLDRSVTRYALFDFGNSKQYSSDISIDRIQDTRFFGFELRGYPIPDEPYNPFQVEMLSVGDVLQRRVRHIENIVPELGPFFDAMMDADPKKRLTARQALNSFNKMYSNLSESQLNHGVTTLTWDNGVVKAK